MRPPFRLLFLLLSCTASLSAQSIFGKNVVVNGDAESSLGGNGDVVAATIPGWTKTGPIDVITYASGYTVGVGDPGPLDRKNNLFSGGPKNKSSSMTQKVDLTSGATTIDAGAATFDASAYLGGYSSYDSSPTVNIAFLDASGKQLATAALGAVLSIDRRNTGIYLRRKLGPLPVGTRSTTITVVYTASADDNYNDAYADNISLILNAPATTQSLLGVNIIYNGDAEKGAGLTDDTSFPLDIPRWVRSSDFATDNYINLDSVPANVTGPPDRGKLFFYGGQTVVSTGYQDIDISSASGNVDLGQIRYNFSAWIGGYSSQEDNCVVTIQFRNWAGTVLGTAKLGPVTSSDRGGTTGMLLRTTSGTIPAGTRYANVLMTSTRLEGLDNDGYADSLSLILSLGGGAPAISPNGVISAAAFGGSTSIGPGSWIEIYGQNFAATGREWAGADFSGSTAPTTLDGIKVTVGGQPAYVRYISSGQVNAQVSSSTGTGQQPVVVTNGTGSSTPYNINVNATQPGLLAPASFILNGKQYLAAFLSNGTSFVGPPNLISGAATLYPAPGDTIITYGIGFGPTTPSIVAGQIVSQSNQLSLPIAMSFAGSPVTFRYAGLAPGFVGLYQFNIVVPKIANSDAVPITYSVGGVASTQTLYTAVHN